MKDENKLWILELILLGVVVWLFVLMLSG